MFKLSFWKYVMWSFLKSYIKEIVNNLDVKKKIVEVLAFY